MTLVPASDDVSTSPSPRSSGPRVGLLIGSLERGGAQQAAMRLLQSLLESGYEAFLLTLDRNRELLDDLGDTCSRDVRSRLVRLSPSLTRNATWMKVGYAPWQWLNLARHARKLRLEVLVSFMERANIVTLLSSSPCARIVSVRSHFDTLMNGKQALKRRLISTSYPLLLARASRIVFNSREAALSFAGAYPQTRDRLVVVPNHCDVAGLRRLAAAPDPDAALAEAGPTVVTCGRLIRDKGHAQLIAAFARVAREHATAKLVIVGAGPLEAELRELCERLGLQRRVVLPGHRVNPFPLMARASLFVLPSLREGFPNALLEAMALGVPVLAADCRSGPRELLAPRTDPLAKTDTVDVAECGVLAPAFARDEDAGVRERKERVWARAVTDLLADADLRARLGASAAQRACHFSAERVVAEWTALLQQVTTRAA